MSIYTHRQDNILEMIKHDQIECVFNKTSLILKPDKGPVISIPLLWMRFIRVCINVVCACTGL